MKSRCLASADAKLNLALNRPAEQSSVSQWSVAKRPAPQVDWAARTRETLQHCDRLLRETPAGRRRARFREQPSREIIRLAPEPRCPREPLLSKPVACSAASPCATRCCGDFDTLLFTKRVPGSFNHMSDQYYGWWSKPGGGIFLLRDFLGANA